MKLISPSVELITQEDGLEGIYKQIERVGRTCYKSENLIKEGSAKPFVDRMIDNKHYAMLEHGTVYLTVPATDETKEIADRYRSNPYSKVKYVVVATHKNYYITTNYRVIVEHKWQDDLRYLSAPKGHDERITLKFTTSIGVSREGNRHRTFSIAEQSTRYCNYSKSKFGGEVTYMIPAWLGIPTGRYVHSLYEKTSGEVSIKWECLDNGKSYDVSSVEGCFLGSLKNSEEAYLYLMKNGWKPQQAREVLPLSTATEVVYTAYKEDWRHFFDLRYRGTTGTPHPNMVQIATMAHDLIKDKLEMDL